MIARSHSLAALTLSGVLLSLSSASAQGAAKTEAPAKTEAKAPAKTAAPAKTPAKTKPAKTEPAKAPAKTEPAKTAPAKAEPAKAPAKTEPAKAPAKTAPAKAGSLAAATAQAGLYAKLETSHGTIAFRFYAKSVPKTTAHIAGLIEGSKQWIDPRRTKRVKRPFYQGLTFHRVIDGFMIQGGCPMGNGRSGPGYAIRDETVRGVTHRKAGIVSMANSDRPGKKPYSNTGRSNGSQFFITLRPTPNLDGLHTVFGEVVFGMDVVRKIGKTKTDGTDKPVTPVVIKKASLIKVGRTFPSAPAGAPDPARVPKAGQPQKSLVEVRLICLRFVGSVGSGPQTTLSKDAALAAAKTLAALARAPKANFKALAVEYSDLGSRTFKLVRKLNDKSLLPAYRLTKGQVSEPVVTPYGVMVFEGQ